MDTLPRLPRGRARNALVAALLGLASIPVGLLLVAEDERALESEPSTASDRFTDAATAAARAIRHAPPLEAPASPSSGPDVAIARRHVELRPVELRGRTIDVVTRRPIANATLRGGSRVVRADGRGELRILQDSAGSFAFVVEAEGYCQLHGRLEAGNSGSPAWIELPLLASSPVEGRVIDVDGRPVAEAAVSTVALRAAETAEPPPGTPAGWNQVPEGLGVRVGTDADGRFRLPGLVPYSKGLGLRVVRSGFVAEVREITAAGPGVATRHEVVLRYEEDPGRGEVVGTVRINGEPMGAELRWRTTSGSGTGTASRDGFYRLGNVETGVVRVSAFPASWSVGKGAPEIPGGTARVVVAAGERARHDFDLVVPMAAISGRVTHDDGSPGAGRPVLADASNGLRFRTVTDAAGCYRLEVPDLGEPFRVRPGTDIGTPSRGQVPPGASGVDFVLPDLTELVLCVRDAATAAELQRFAVFVRPAGTRAAWEPPQSARDRSADGFRFRSFVGAVDVEVRRRGYSSRVLEGVTVQTGARTRLEIELARDSDR